MSWITPVTDRGSDAKYTYSDLNRVGSDVQYLADLLHGYGYAVSVAPKTDWVVGDHPQEADITQYLSDLNALKTAYYSSAVLPSEMRALKFTDANNIEAMLVNIEAKINRMILSFWGCGEIGCGEI